MSTPRLRRHGRASTKLSDAQIFEIRRRIAAGEVQRQIARDYGLTAGAVNHIATGRRLPVCEQPPPPPVKDPAVRFMAKVSPEPMSGCWLWLGCHSSARGYGFFSIDYASNTSGRGAKHTMAHRAAWLLFRGPIPDGLVIDHKCSNTACVNPAHLEPVTQQINVARGRRHYRPPSVRTTYATETA